MKHNESLLQQACVKYFRMQYPKYLIYANANGGYRSPTEAKIMHGEGVLSGIPDLTIVTPHRVIWVEMKSESGKVTPAQETMMQRISELGYCVCLCWNFEDFVKVCERYVNQ